MELKEGKYVKKITGDAGEEAACQLLKESGYEIVARNFRAARGEIDIIAEDDKYIVFVEVKTRDEKNTARYRSPHLAVNLRKRKNIVSAATVYRNMRKSPKFYRFDIIEVYLCHDPITGAGSYRLNHMKGVFGAGGRVGFR
ncbi:MAG: YraN family protein [Clostridia bacterium]|nr:YraN family protein [Clostridia bacterium]